MMRRWEAGIIVWPWKRDRKIFHHTQRQHRIPDAPFRAWPGSPHRRWACNTHDRPQGKWDPYGERSHSSRTTSITFSLRSGFQSNFLPKVLHRIPTHRVFICPQQADQLASVQWRIWINGFAYFHGEAWFCIFIIIPLSIWILAFGRMFNLFKKSSRHRKERVRSWKYLRLACGQVLEIWDPSLPPVK